MAKTQSKIQEVRSSLKKAFHERDTVVDGTMVALLAKEMIFLLGPPGTAKSAVCESVCGSIGGTYFSWLVSKFTTPEELFGPLSLKGLENDKYVRITKNKLPEATVAFLDEIFKGSSAILNTLLPVINERKFYNGDSPTKIPLQVLFGASNEIPDAPELAALYDRFALRYKTDRLKNDSSAEALFQAGFSGAAGQAISQITPGELEVEQAAAMKTTVTDDIVKALVLLRRHTQDEGIYVSDRKWVQSTRVLKAYAYLNGHASVELDDLEILENVLWTTPEQAKTVKRLIARVSNPLGEQITKIVDAVNEIAARIHSGASQKSEAIEGQAKIKDSLKKLQALGDPAKNAALGKAVRQVQEINTKILKDHFGLE